MEKNERELREFSCEARVFTQSRQKVVMSLFRLGQNHFTPCKTGAGFPLVFGFSFALSFPR